MTPRGRHPQFDKQEAELVAARCVQRHQHALDRIVVLLACQHLRNPVGTLQRRADLILGGQVEVPGGKAARNRDDARILVDDGSRQGWFAQFQEDVGLVRSKAALGLLQAKQPAFQPGAHGQRIRLCAQAHVRPQRFEFGTPLGGGSIETARLHTGEKALELPGHDHRLHHQQGRQREQQVEQGQLGYKPTQAAAECVHHDRIVPEMRQA